MVIDEKSLKNLAKSIMIEVSQEEEKGYLEYLNQTIEQFTLLEIPHVDTASPVDFPYSVMRYNVLREDIPLTTLSAEQVIENAQESEGAYIKIKKVIE